MSTTKLTQDEFEYVKFLITFAPEELVECMMSKIEDRDKNRVKMLKAAVHVGLDLNADINEGMTLLQYAINKGDMLTVGNMVNYGADVNKKNMEGESCLHICCKSGNKHLLTFILSKGAYINALDESRNSPLLVAGHYENIECVDILIKQGAKIDIKNRNKHTVSEVMLYKIRHLIDDTDESPKIIDKRLDLCVQIYKLIMAAKKKKINNRELKLIRDISAMNLIEEISFFTADKKRYDYDIVKIAMEKNPKIINIPCDEDNNTLMLQAICTGKKIFIDYFSTNEKIDWTHVNKLKKSYLHMAANRGMVDLVKLVVEKCPTLCKSAICSYGMTPIEDALVSGMPDSVMIEMLRILSTGGVDINSRNKSGFRSLEIGTQYCSPVVVSELIDLGSDIKAKRIRNKILYPINNNDIVGHAAQNGRLDILKLLLEKGAPIHTANVIIKCGSKNHEIVVPTPLVIALLYRVEQVAIYLLSLETIQSFLKDNNDNNNDKLIEPIKPTKPTKQIYKIKPTEKIKKTGKIKHPMEQAEHPKDQAEPIEQPKHPKDQIYYVKKYLLKIAVDEGITNHNILLNFIPESSYESMCVKHKKSLIEIYEIIIARNIPPYRENKNIVINCMYYITYILHKIFTSETDKDYDLIFGKLEELCDVVSMASNIFETIINGIAAILSHNIHEIKKCMKLIKRIYDYGEIPNAKFYIKSLRKLELSTKINELAKTLQMTKKVFWKHVKIGSNCKKNKPIIKKKLQTKDSDSSDYDSTDYYCESDEENTSDYECSDDYSDSDNYSDDTDEYSTDTEYFTIDDDDDEIDSNTNNILTSEIQTDLITNNNDAETQSDDNELFCDTNSDSSESGNDKLISANDYDTKNDSQVLSGESISSSSNNTIVFAKRQNSFIKSSEGQVTIS